MRRGGCEKMMNIILSGCSGKMGKTITNLVKKNESCRIVAGVDKFDDGSISYPVFPSIDQVSESADVVIDFSNPDMLSSLLIFCKSRKIPLVLCTTGFSSVQIEEIKNVSKEIPIFFSGNMSMGINLLISLARVATKVLGKDFDIEIIEKHHNQKIDAPSGTALMIADAVSKELELEPQYVYDRHSSRKKRSKNEIGIHSIRGGTIVGEHEVLFAGQDEVVSITHSASSKVIFANGAINAALFILSLPNGLYTMDDLVKTR